MKEKEKINFQNLLSWEEVFALGEPSTKYTFLLSPRFFKGLCTNNYNVRLFMDDYENYVIKPLIEKLPKLADIIPYMEIRIRYNKNEDGSQSLVICPEFFFLELITNCLANKKAKEEIKILSLACANNGYDYTKETILRHLDMARKLINEKRYNASNGDMVFNTLKKDDGEELELTFTDSFKKINWAYKNFDYIYNTVLSVNNYEFLNNISKDVFLLQTCYFVFYEDSLLLQSGKREVDDKGLLFLHNYCLLVDYLSEVNGEKYDISSVNKEAGVKFKTSYVYNYIQEVNEANSDNQEYQELVCKYKTYEDLLKAKANSTWNRIIKERFYETIECNWDVIPDTENILKSSNNIVRTTRYIKSSEKIEAKMKKAYDILDQKVDVFYKEECQQLVGKNNFEGYIGFLYPNNLVIFERFYRVSKRNSNHKVPAINEAIYVMNSDNFAELSKLTKSEIISYIKDFGNKDIMRIYHRGNWKDRINMLIHASNYDENDLTMIESLTSDLDKTIEEKQGKQKKYV